MEEYYNAEKKKRPIEEEQQTQEKPQDESITDNEAAEETLAGTANADEKNDSVSSKKKGRSNKVSPAKASKQSVETNALDESTTRSVRLKSLNADKEANLYLYLEDYFDIVCSFQDDTQRYLANVFYDLPSVKVSLNLFLNDLKLGKCIVVCK